MWLPVFLLILGGALATDHEHAWRIGQEYNYLVRSRTLTGLDALSNQFTGILIKAQLTVQPKDADTLRAKVWRTQYANMHKELPDDWDSEISSRALDLRDMPMSNKPFEIKTKHGLIRELIVDKDVPTWEVNILKSIVSQLQVDTQAENEISSKSTQVPEEDSPYAMFKAMEDSVGGKCEVHYDITPLPEDIVQSKPELVPIPKLKGDGHHIDIVKTKNYTKCEQRVDYHFGIDGKMNWEPGSNDNGKFLSKFTTSRIVISGNLNRFVIQSSVTTNKIFVSPRMYDYRGGIVASRMNLTLINVEKIADRINSPSNPESVGNLVYTFNNPFSEFMQRRPGKANVSPNSAGEKDSGSRSAVSSSEERQDHNKRSSGSDSASSSSISSSEERDFWQPKPSLEKAPENPLLPFFIGNRDKSIGMSDRIEPIEATKALVAQITNELDDPNSIPKEKTLEKFIILTELIRTMSRKQISEAEANMHLSKNDLQPEEKSKWKKQGAWATFRDAVTQAGTGPALLTIKDWIESGKVKDLEAADVLSRLAKTARTPTAEYVDKLFELITSAEVMKHDIVSGTAVLMFADLVRQSQLSNVTLHNRYPVHTFGRLAPKHHQAVMQVYLPYFEEQLKKAMKDGDSHKAQIFILGLGHMAHPRILGIFEPYLEGKEPATVFQRTMMVGALFKLAELQPKLTRSVLYKIYLNTMEAHDVRCMAVYLLMKTDPPLGMLQRMADFTKYDTSKHVNSAVKTMIEYLDDMTLPEYRGLAEKARAARNLLSDEEYSYQYSQAYILNGVLKDENLAYRLLANYIGSDDSFLARSWYIGLDTKYGDFKAPTATVSFMISSMRSLLHMYDKDKREADKSMRPGEKIAQILGIKPAETVPLEGHFLWDNKYGTQMFTIDEDKIRNVLRGIGMTLGRGDNSYINMNKFTNYEVTLSFPTETGLPFVYTLKIPTLGRIAGKNKPSIGEGVLGTKSELRVVYSKMLQGRVGFVAPFERQHYIAGVDMNFQAYAPFKFDIEVKPKEKSVQAKLWSIEGERNTRLFHYSVVPYTSKHDILSLRPVDKDKNTQKVHTSQPQKVSIKKMLPVMGAKSVAFDLEADDLSDITIPDLDKMELYEVALFPWSQHDDSYRKIDISIDSDKDQQNPLVFGAVYGRIETGTEDVGEWPTRSKAVEPSDKKPNSAERRKQLLKEAVKGLKSGTGHVLDIKLEEAEKFHSTLTVAWSESNVKDKSRALGFWQFESPRNHIKTEICGISQVESNINELLSYSQTVHDSPKVYFDAHVKYGSTCSEGEELKLTGKAFRSEDMLETVQKTPMAKKCEKQMAQNNKILEDCRKAASAATIVNEMDLTVEVPSQPIQMGINAMLELANKYGSTLKIDKTNPKNAGKNKIDINLKIDADFSSDLTVHTPTMDAGFKGVEFLDEDTSALENLDSWNEEDTQFVCALDGTQAETFDLKRYPLKLGKCWHVATTTVPLDKAGESREFLPIPENMRFTVLVRDADHGREVKVILDNQEIRMSSSGSDLKVTVDGHKIGFSKDSSYQKKENEEVLYEIFELPDGSIRLLSDKYLVGVVYDGERVRIQADDNYQSWIRGLCGNFDANKENDFVSPKGCMVKNSDEFQATYALVDDDCEGPAVENIRKVEKSECTKRTHRFSNVISDIEAGRVKEGRKWGHHRNSQDKKGSGQCISYRTKVLTKNDKICFSTRPVPSCAPGCESTEQTKKTYKFHCMDKTEAALEMKRRVEKGANPDLSQKSVSLEEPLHVPVQCSA